MFLSSCFSFPACKSRLSASYYIIICDRLVLLYYPTWPHKQLDSRKRNTEHKMFDFLYKFVWIISHSGKNSERYCLFFMQSTCYSYKGLLKLEVSWHIFEKSENIKFHENQSSGSPVLPCGRTVKTKLIIAFRNSTNAPKDVSLSHYTNTTRVVPKVMSNNFL